MTITMTQAVSDFEKERNRASIQSAIGWLTGRDYDLVSYNKVRSRLSQTYNLPPVLKEIPLDSIVGSVSRDNDFSRTFLPRMEHDKQRWAKVRALNESPVGMDPIDVYQVGEVYFVLDGHHRISVMRSINAKFIMANVIIINTDVPLEPDDSPDEIIVKTERQAFFNKTNADKIMPKVNLELREPDQYPRLLEHIAVHRYYMGLEAHREISMKDAILNWYKRVYLPVVRVVRSRNMLSCFPKKTETELYLWIQEHQAELIEEYGENVRVSSVAWNLENRFARRKNRLLARLKLRLFTWLTPNFSDWGLQTGDWRKSHSWTNAGQLIRRMLVTSSRLDEDMEYIRGAIRMAKRFDSWVGIVHVLSAGANPNDQKYDLFQRNARSLLESEGVNGDVFILKGNLLKQISERAFWSDITLFPLRHRPPLNWYKRLGSSWLWIFTHVPGPIMTVPDVIPENINRILLAYDASPKAREAMFFAGAMGKKENLEIIVVISGFNGAQREASQNKVANYFAQTGIQAQFINEEGNPDALIVKSAEAYRADLIVMGGYSKGMPQRIWRPSIVDKVVCKTNIPVIVCK